MDIDLATKRAIVTGGGSGIGAATARTLARSGAHVTVVDINPASAAAVAKAIGGTALTLDLSDVTALADIELDADILVNNAGIQHVSPVHEFPPDKFALLLRLMVEAPFLLARAVLPGMYERGWGRLIHVSSVHGLRASPFKSGYVAAKHGLEGLSKVLALEGGPHGVTSNTVCPAYVRTPLVDRQIEDQARTHGIAAQDVIEKIMLTEPAIKRLIEPEEVAAAIAWLCGSASSFVNGTSITMDGGWTAR